MALTLFSAPTMVQSGMSLVLLPLYLTALSPADYGALALVNVVATLFGTASNLKLDAAMRTHYFDHSRDAAALADYLRHVFTATLAISAVLYVAMLALGEPLFGLLFARKLEFFPAGAIAAATAAINGCLAVYFVYLRNRLALREVVAWQLVVVAGTIVCQLVFVLVLNLGFHGVLWGSLLPAALTLLLICAMQPGLIELRLEWRRLVPSLKYSLPLVALAVCLALATRLDRLVLQHYVDLAALGAYALLVSVLGLFAIVLVAVDGAIRPYLFEALKERGARATEAIEAYQELYCLIGLVTLSAAVFIGSNLHLVVEEPGYLTMREWLPYGAMACLPLIFVWYYSLLHEFHKRSIDLTFSVAVRLVVLLVLLLMLVPRFGVGGAIAALGAAETIMALLLCTMAVRRLAVRPPLRGVGLQVAVFVVAVWGAGAVVGPHSPAMAGTLQFIVVVGLLLATNRRALRRLARRTDVDGDSLGEKTTSVGQSR